MNEFPTVKVEYEKLARELAKGDAKGLRLRCGICDDAGRTKEASKHLTRDCPYTDASYEVQPPEVHPPRVVKFEAQLSDALHLLHEAESTPSNVSNKLVPATNETDLDDDRNIASL